MSYVLEVNDLHVSLKSRKKEQELLHGISFSVHEGECLGILGESGSGKSMTMKSVLGLLDKQFVTTGEALFCGRNLIGQSSEELRHLRGGEISMVLQNPMTCFDPLYRIGRQMAETFACHSELCKDEIRKESVSILERMHISNSEEVLEKYPHQLSGGMLQRIMIGLSLAFKPRLLVADEPTTAIDAITQKEILEAFLEIRRKHNTSMIFISHDLGAVSAVADRILVMNKGLIVDRGDFSHIVNNATDSYTKLLIEKRSAVMKRYIAMTGGGYAHA